ncbi:MAG: DUF2061 domain-containing protein [Candidatus Hodarchaeota archaeon]
MSDDHSRSLVKSASYRLLGLCYLLIISYIITGSFWEMVEINAVYHTLRIFDYYFHERLWEHIPWGRIRDD